MQLKQEQMLDVSTKGGLNLYMRTLEQIHEDDIEEMDLKWQLALLSMRTRRGPRNQDNRNMNQDISRRTVNVEKTSFKSMLAIDGAGFDWSYMADDEVPTNMALMDFLDSEEFQQPEFEGYGPKTSKNVSEDTSNEVRKSPDALMVEKLVSDDKIEKKTIFPSIAKIEFVRAKQHEKPVRKSVKLTAITIKRKGWYLGNSYTRISVHVTILNTLDYLGKFDGKSDEGDGPKWLFDIDVLTKSMNYVTVVAGTNSNNSNTSNDEPQPSSDAEKKDDEGVNKASGIDDQERPKNSTQDVNTAGLSINTGSTNVNTELYMSNITTTYLVPTTPNTRIYKDHSLDHVIGDVQSGEEPIWFIQALKDSKLDRRLCKEELMQIEAIRTILSYASFKDFWLMYQMDGNSAFLYGKIKEEVYICKPLGFEDPEFPDKVYKIQVTLKLSHLHAMKRIFKILEKLDYSCLLGGLSFIEIRHHFIRDSNGKKLIQMIKIHTYQNVADLLTKAFDVGRFQYLIAKANDEIQVSVVGLTYYWRKDIEIPQSSGSTKPITDEAANEEHVPTHSSDPLRSEVTLVNEAQGRNDDNLMFDIEVLYEQEAEVEKVVSIVEVTTVKATTTTVDELTLAQTLI
ncbi:putative ribonuclease H-like domain-containing protein [Tanacetum coccineum]